MAPCRCRQRKHFHFSFSHYGTNDSQESWQVERAIASRITRSSLACSRRSVTLIRGLIVVLEMGREMKGPGGSNDSPFAYKNGMQSIAFINNHFPALSATFIYREVLGLRRRGVPIKTYSIRRPSAGTLSEESLDLLNSTTYLLPVAVRDFIAAHLHFIARGPIGYLRVFLFLMTRKYVRPVKDRLRTCFHFCEGVHFAKMIRDDGNI